VFDPEYAGSQGCAMVIANIVYAEILSPMRWSKLSLDNILLEGHRVYGVVRLSSPSEGAFSVRADGHLFMRHFDPLRDELDMFQRTCRLEYDRDPALFGCLKDVENRGDVGVSLLEGLTKLFRGYRAGVLIACGQCFGVLQYDAKYYFTNSHSCGPKGAKAQPKNGKACVIECDTLHGLARVCKQATGSKSETYFTLDYVNVIFQDNSGVAEACEVISQESVQVVNGAVTNVGNMDTTTIGQDDTEMNVVSVQRESAYVVINDVSRIIWASFEQSNPVSRSCFQISTAIFFKFKLSLSLDVCF